MLALLAAAALLRPETVVFAAALLGAWGWAAWRAGRHSHAPGPDDGEPVRSPAPSWRGWVAIGVMAVLYLWWLPATLAPMFVSRDTFFVGRRAEVADWVTLGRLGGVTAFTFVSAAPIDEGDLAAAGLRPYPSARATCRGCTSRASRCPHSLHRKRTDPGKPQVKRRTPGEGSLEAPAADPPSPQVAIERREKRDEHPLRGTPTVGWALERAQPGGCSRDRCRAKQLPTIQPPVLETGPWTSPPLTTF